MKIYYIILISISLSAANTIDTTEKTMAKDSIKDIFRTPNNNFVTKNPVTSAAISAILPGGGQIYTGNYIKSGMFIASEVIIGLVAYNRYIVAKDLSKSIKVLQDSMNLFKDMINVTRDSVRNKSNTMDSIHYDTTFLALRYQMNYEYNRFLDRDNRCFIYQSLAWMGGLYYWNILDALKNTKYFMNDNPKKPSTAGWLAAIPALGLGQLYNGELSKAGMIFMI